MFRRSISTFGLVTVALVLTACPTGTTAPSASPAAKAQVSSGSNVTATVSDPGLSKPATITFGSVTTAGEVALTTSATGPALPTGFALSTGTYFDITTTATFDKATVCFEDGKVTSRSKLYHFTSNTWNDRTTTVAPPKICGDFTSFSPVVIVESTTAAATATPTTAPTSTPAATATATAAATATATATAAATPTPAATAAPTPAPTAAPTAAPTVAPTVAPTPAPTPVPTPVPTPAPVANAPACPTSGLAICGRVTDSATGQAIPQACITLGPPIRCWTTTGGDGRYVINLSDVAAQPGSQWDLYALRTTPEPKYAQVYSGVFIVSGIITKDFTLTKQ